MDSLNPTHARFGAVRQPASSPDEAAGSRTRDAFSELHAALDELSATLSDLDRTLAARTDDLCRLHEPERPDLPDVGLAA